MVLSGEKIAPSEIMKSVQRLIFDTRKTYCHCSKFGILSLFFQNSDFRII